MPSEERTQGSTATYPACGPTLRNTWCITSERVSSPSCSSSSRYALVLCFKILPERLQISHDRALSVLSTFKTWRLVSLYSSLQDPHFKASTHRRRIISTAQLADYAFLLAPGGMLYTITDVPELGAWMREKVLPHFRPSKWFLQQELVLS